MARLAVLVLCAVPSLIRAYLRAPCRFTKRRQRTLLYVLFPPCVPFFLFIGLPAALQSGAKELFSMCCFLRVCRFSF